MKSRDKRTPDFRVYLIMVLCATIFWFVAKVSKRYEHVVEVPLLVKLDNPDFTLKNPAPSTVRAGISGRGFDILRLPFYEPVCEIDLTGIQDSISFNLSEYKDFIRLPDDLQISVRSIVAPHQIEFFLDRSASRKIPVVIESKVNTAPGFTLVRTVSEPESVLVQGPASYVDTLSALSTTFMEYDAVESAFRERLKLNKNNTFYSKQDPEIINAFFDVQRLAEKEVNNVPVHVINVPANLEVVPLPSYVRVYAKGGEKVLAVSRPEDFRVVIDFQRDWKRGIKRVSAAIETSLDLRVVEPRPSNFELIVQKRRKEND